MKIDWDEVSKRLDKYSIPEPNSGCFLWFGSSPSNRGYGSLTIFNKSYRAHRLVWELNFGPIPAELFVCHSCDTPACINPLHLFLGTHQDNVDDKVSKLRQSRLVGEANPISKLVPSQVLAIRADTDPQRAIARKYGVSQRLVLAIKKHTAWSHL